MNLRELGLRGLEEDIRVCRQLTLSAEGEGKSLPEQEAHYIEVLYRADRILTEAYRFKSLALTDRLAEYLGAGWSPDGIPRLRLRMDEPIVDLRRLPAPLHASAKDLAERETVALAVADVVIGQAMRVQTEVLGTGSIERDPCWPLVMLALCNGYPEAPVCQLRKALEPGEGTDPAATLPGQMWQAILGLAEEAGTSLGERVQALEPPLTWAEVLYRFLQFPADGKGDPAINQRRREMGKWTSPPSQSYCLKCHRPFTVDKRHPGRFVCPRCNTADWQRQKRQRERQTTS